MRCMRFLRYNKLLLYLTALTIQIGNLNAVLKVCPGHVAELVPIFRMNVRSDRITKGTDTLQF